MNGSGFVRELEDFRNERLGTLEQIGVQPLGGAPANGGDMLKLLQIALANEISVSELAAAWMPNTPEVDVKIGLAKQSGDEARHFTLVADRLTSLGFNIDEFTPPGLNPLFEFLRSLPTSVERVAAGQFTLEAIAYGVNEKFITLCEQRGDDETVRIYREYIQPDERVHERLGRSLLEKYVRTPDQQLKAREAVARTLEIAAKVRTKAAAQVGTACFPGC